MASRPLLGGQQSPAAGAGLERCASSGFPAFTPLGIGSGLHFWGSMERKKEIFNNLMERVARVRARVRGALHPCVRGVVTFRDVLQMCCLWSDMPLTANLWSQFARCSSPLWRLSRRVIQDCGCSAEIWILPGVRRRGRAVAVPAVEASHLQPQSSTQGAGCDRCAVAIHGVVPQRGSLRVWQAARARDSDALGASNRREIRGLGCCRRRRV